MSWRSVINDISHKRQLAGPPTYDNQHFVERFNYCCCLKLIVMFLSFFDRLVLEIPRGACS